MASKRQKSQTPNAVREPIQIYLDPGDRSVLDDVASHLGLSRAEVLRRSLRAWARQQSGEGPVLKLVRESAAAAWPAGPSNVGLHHDAHLAESYLDTHEDAP